MSAWKEIASAKLAARDAFIPTEWKIPSTEAKNVLDIPRTCGILTPSELEITETDATVLVDRMVRGELKSREVTGAFCKRAAIAQQLVNTTHPQRSTAVKLI